MAATCTSRPRRPSRLTRADAARPPSSCSSGSRRPRTGSTSTSLQGSTLDADALAAVDGRLETLDPPRRRRGVGSYRKRVARDACAPRPARRVRAARRGVTELAPGRASRSTAPARDGLVEPRVTLADFLRDVLGLKGTHVACEHGFCGNCNVLLDGETVRVVPDVRRAGAAAAR